MNTPPTSHLNPVLECPQKWMNSTRTFVEKGIDKVRNYWKKGIPSSPPLQFDALGQNVTVRLGIRDRRRAMLDFSDLNTGKRVSRPLHLICPTRNCSPEAVERVGTVLRNEWTQLLTKHKFKINLLRDYPLDQLCYEQIDPFLTSGTFLQSDLGIQPPLEVVAFDLQYTMSMYPGGELDIELSGNYFPKNNLSSHAKSICIFTLQKGLCFRFLNNHPTNYPGFLPPNYTMTIEEDRVSVLKKVYITLTPLTNIGLASLKTISGQARLAGVVHKLNSIYHFREFEIVFDFPPDSFRIPSPALNCIAVEPHFVPSSLDPTVPISRFRWGVAVLSLSGKTSCAIAVEGITDNFFKKNSPIFKDLQLSKDNDPSFRLVIAFSETAEIKMDFVNNFIFDGRTPVFLRSAKKIKKMLIDINQGGFSFGKKQPIEGIKEALRCARMDLLPYHRSLFGAQPQDYTQNPELLSLQNEKI